MKKQKIEPKADGNGDAPEFRADVDVVRVELAKIGGNGTEPLRAQNVVDAARPVTSPIHALFEWDDGKAAENYRLSQARRLIQIVMVRREVTMHENDGPATIIREQRGWLSVAVTGGYRPIEVVQAKPTLREDTLKRALRDVETAATSPQYTAFAELDGFRAEVQNLVNRWRYKLELS